MECSSQEVQIYAALGPAHGRNRGQTTSCAISQAEAGDMDNVTERERENQLQNAPFIVRST